jgi:RNA polymerase sigma factor (sigma-70 family)
MPEWSGFWNTRLSVYQTAVHRYFRRHAARPEDAEDLAQEVYVRLLRADERQQGHVENAQAYLFTVAANLLKERALLTARAGFQVPLDDRRDDLVGPDEAPEDALYAQTRSRRLWAIIEGLPPRSRAVLLLHYRYDLTYRDIGERIGVTSHTVKKYLSHALVLCRHALRDAGDWP